MPMCCVKNNGNITPTLIPRNEVMRNKELHCFSERFSVGMIKFQHSSLIPTYI